VYVNHDATTEGPGTWPQFTTKQILAGWDYTPTLDGTVLIPNVSAPAFPTTPSTGGPYAWLSTKVRTYTIAPGTSGTGDNIPPT
jgi:hypothetical protein